MASSGNGTSVHMSGELFMEMTGAKMTHVPYRGSNPALTDLMGGQVQVLFDNMPSSIELIKGGKIRALGVTTEKRAAYFPDLPTVAETVPGYEASAWFGMGVKAGTPPDVIAYLNREFAATLDTPEVNNRLVGLGLTVPKMSDNTVADLTKHIDEFAATYGKLIAELGIKAE